MGYKILMVDTLAQRWAHFLRLTIVTPSGERMLRDIEDHGESAVVLAFDPLRRKALLVEQFRAPAFFLGEDGMSLEPIAGRVDDGQTPEETAKREAMEEAGVRLSVL